jgi:hypothetical protein
MELKNNNAKSNTMESPDATSEHRSSTAGATEGKGGFAELVAELHEREREGDSEKTDPREREDARYAESLIKRLWVEYLHPHEAEWLKSWQANHENPDRDEVCVGRMRAKDLGIAMGGSKSSALGTSTNSEMGTSTSVVVGSFASDPPRTTVAGRVAGGAKFTVSTHFLKRWVLIQFPKEMNRSAPSMTRHIQPMTAFVPTKSSQRGFLRCSSSSHERHWKRTPKRRSVSSNKRESTGYALGRRPLKTYGDGWKICGVASERLPKLRQGFRWSGLLRCTPGRKAPVRPLHRASGWPALSDRGRDAPQGLRNQCSRSVVDIRVQEGVRNLNSLTLTGSGNLKRPSYPNPQKIGKRQLFTVSQRMH